MKKENIFMLFDKAQMDIYNKQYDNENKTRYENNVYKEIYKKVSKYKKDDWNNIRENLDFIYNNAISLMDKAPANKEVQETVEDLRQHFSNNYYDCNLNMFRALGRLYITDENFRENVDERKEGLAQFLSEAIEVYCDNLENNA